MYEIVDSCFSDVDIRANCRMNFNGTKLRIRRFQVRRPLEQGHWHLFLSKSYHFSSKSSTDFVVSVCSTSRFSPEMASETCGFGSNETSWTGTVYIIFLLFNGLILAQMDKDTLNPNPCYSW